MGHNVEYCLWVTMNLSHNNYAHIFNALDRFSERDPTLRCAAIGHNSLEKIKSLHGSDTRNYLTARGYLCDRQSADFLNEGRIMLRSATMGNGNSRSIHTPPLGVASACSDDSRSRHEIDRVVALTWIDPSPFEKQSTKTSWRTSRHTLENTSHVWFEGITEIMATYDW